MLHTLLLLASVFAVLLSDFTTVTAAPVTSGAVVSLPIRSLHHRATDDDIPATLALGQLMNRANRRFARLTLREEPSYEEAATHLIRRINKIHLGFAAGNNTLSKRFVVIPSGEGEASNNFRSTGQFHGGSGGRIIAPGSGKGINSFAEGDSTDVRGVSPIDIKASQTGAVTKAGKPTAKQSIGLDVESRDVGYFAEVQIGTPPRPFRMVMDSGSADFWVGSEDCRSTAGGGCGNHTLLGPKSSSSFKPSNRNFAITYGTGNVAGVIIQDEVSLAGLSLKKHTFGVANVESPEFSSTSTDFDGILGTARSQLSQQKTLTPVEKLKADGTIRLAIVAYKISRISDQKNDGQITFGGVDSNKFDINTLVTVPNVNRNGFWEAPFIPTVNGQSVGLDQGRTAIVDTGTTLIVAPAADAAAIHGAIKGSRPDGDGGFIVPCTMNETVALSFGGRVFNIDPRDIAFLPIRGSAPDGECTSGISSGSIGRAGQWLVGDVFLKNAYFVTNADTNTLSFAKLK